MNLLQTLEDKECYYEESMRVLRDMLGNWQTFWHFNWLKDNFDMITNVRALQLSLRAKLQSAFQKMLEECVNRDVIETDRFRYTYGPNWTDFVGGISSSQSACFSPI